MALPAPLPTSCGPVRERRRREKNNFNILYSGETDLHALRLVQLHWSRLWSCCRSSAKEPILASTLGHFNSAVLILPTVFSKLVLRQNPSAAYPLKNLHVTMLMESCVYFGEQNIDARDLFTVPALFHL
jgi:hypothetical protein